MIHMRPSASHSVTIGWSMRGSLATSSARYPGGRTNVLGSSSGESTADSCGTVRTPTGDCGDWKALATAIPTNVIATIAAILDGFMRSLYLKERQGEPEIQLALRVRLEREPHL